MTAPIYLVRHGQSDWNVAERTQGQAMTPRLTELGRQQAEHAAALIAADLAHSDVSVAALCSSDLTRAWETAAILGRTLNAVPTADPRLREQHLGDLQGRPYAETWAAAEQHDWSDEDLPVAGGESPRQVRERMTAVLDELDSTAVTVLVSHGDALRIALTALSGEASWVAVPNGAVARVVGRDVRWLGARERADRCPGVTRPWLADDGALVRIRLVGGRISAGQLAALSQVAREHGDGDLHVTGRANVQLRALPHRDGRLSDPAYDALVGTGLVPSIEHDLVRNIMVSPLTGRRGGRADLRSTAEELDRLIRTSPRLADLPGRFLFVLDDGRGDLADRDCDLGLVALDAGQVQLRVGDGFGQVVALGEAPDAILACAHRFLEVRGTGPTAAWHVRELGVPLIEACPRDSRVEVRSPPLAHDDEHILAPGGVISTDLADRLAAYGGELVVTPWHGVLAPDRDNGSP